MSKRISNADIDRIALEMWLHASRRSAITNQPQHFKLMPERLHYRKLALFALKLPAYDEPTCIKCGCQEYSPCPEGCDWVFLNKKTNEGICSQCFGGMAVKWGGA